MHFYKQHFYKQHFYQQHFYKQHFCKQHQTRFRYNFEVVISEIVKFMFLDLL